jgi:hypothetical protein
VIKSASLRSLNVYRKSSNHFARRHRCRLWSLYIYIYIGSPRWIQRRMRGRSQARRAVRSPCSCRSLVSIGGTTVHIFMSRTHINLSLLLSHLFHELDARRSGNQQGPLQFYVTSSSTGGYAVQVQKLTPTSATDCPPQQSNEQYTNSSRTSSMYMLNIRFNGCLIIQFFLFGRSMAYPGFQQYDWLFCTARGSYFAFLFTNRN